MVPSLFANEYMNDKFVNGSWFCELCKEGDREGIKEIKNRVQMKSQWIIQVDEEEIQCCQRELMDSRLMFVRKVVATDVNSGQLIRIKEGGEV